MKHQQQEDEAVRRQTWNCSALPVVLPAELWLETAQPSTLAVEPTSHVSPYVLVNVSLNSAIVLT